MSLTFFSAEFSRAMYETHLVQYKTVRSVNLLQKRKKTLSQIGSFIVKAKRHQSSRMPHSKR